MECATHAHFTSARLDPSRLLNKAISKSTITHSQTLHLNRRSSPSQKSHHLPLLFYRNLPQLYFVLHRSDRSAERHRRSVLFHGGVTVLIGDQVSLLELRSEPLLLLFNNSNETSLLWAKKANPAT